ncbi:polysaccharide deacetylase [Opitutaceae bacterium TAV5]|nr:polysaccharide deacetylase [Opitutaceae bacterium TAV5]
MCIPVQRLFHFAFPLLALPGAGHLAPAAPEGAPDAAPVMIVLKLDDLQTNQSGWLSDRWRRVSAFAQERGIRYSLGVIVNSFESPKPAYQKWLDEVKASGLAEFWFHAWDHKTWTDAEGVERPEFFGRDYSEQTKRFADAQAQAVARLGVPFSVFGPPGGGKPPSLDATTLRVLSEDPHMRGILYPTPLDDAGRALEAAGKITVLDRVWKVNIEQPLFRPNAQKFIEGYRQYAPKRRYFIIQGHPNKWDDARWEEFVKIVDFLTAEKAVFVTPGELIAALEKK